MESYHYERSCLPILWSCPAVSRLFITCLCVMETFLPSRHSAAPRSRVACSPPGTPIRRFGTDGSVRAGRQVMTCFISLWTPAARWVCSTLLRLWYFRPAFLFRRHAAQSAGTWILRVNVGTDVSVYPGDTLVVSDIGFGYFAVLVVIRRTPRCWTLLGMPSTASFLSSG